MTHVTHVVALFFPSRHLGQVANRHLLTWPLPLLATCVRWRFATCSPGPCPSLLVRHVAINLSDPPGVPQVPLSRTVTTIWGQVGVTHLTHVESVTTIWGLVGVTHLTHVRV